jgi:hypothetical protein
MFSRSRRAFPACAGAAGQCRKANTHTRTQQLLDFTRLAPTRICNTIICFACSLNAVVVNNVSIPVVATGTTCRGSSPGRGRRGSVHLSRSCDCLSLLPVDLYGARLMSQLKHTLLHAKGG